MSDNLKKFMEEVSKDRALMEKAKNADVDGLIAMAKELNLELTEEDLKAPEMGELSDDELASVAGGVAYCECPLSGDGSGDGLSCGCTVLGNGFVGEKCRCKCIAIGNGVTEDWKNEDNQTF